MSISLEEFARIRARLDAGRSHADVLADFGFEPSRWLEEEEELLAAISADIEAGELRRIETYRRVYLAEQHALDEPSPPVAPLLDQTGEVDLSALRSSMPFEASLGSNPPATPPTMMLPVERAGDGFMSLDQYLAIAALLEREGDPATSFARIGIEPWYWMRTVHEYARRFAADPLLEAEANARLRRAAGHV